MRSFWLSAWLLASLLVCSAADPRLAIAGAPAAPTRPAKEKPPTPDPDEVWAAIALTGSARAQKIDELSAGWSRRKELLQDTAAAYDQARAAKVHDGVYDGLVNIGPAGAAPLPFPASAPRLSPLPAATSLVLITADAQPHLPLAVRWLVQSGIAAADAGAAAQARLRA